MRKGFILVDIPERCSMCRYMYRTDENYCFCKVEGYGFDYQVNEYMQSKPKGKPDWCPVRKFPEQKKPSQFPISPTLPWQCTEYEKGWNDCIKQMGENDGRR